MRTVDPERHAARRGGILTAAAGVFAEHGYDGATTAAICRAAAIGSGTLFHYFPDKRSIFIALFADDFATMQQVIASLDGVPALDAIGRLIDHLVRDVADPVAPGLVFAAIQLATRDEEFAGVLTANDDQARAALAELLRRAGTAGDVDATLDPVVAARWIHALVDALYFMCGDDGFEPAAEIAMLRTVVARFLRIEAQGWA